jgi:thiamine-phosphate pyrophosphorylase
LREPIGALHDCLQSMGESEIATQHLLWACGVSEHEAADWMRACGLLAEDLLDVRDEAPLDFDDDRMEAGDADDHDADVVQAQAITRDAPRSAVAVWRTLDAAGNRAREGLRVVEDYCRFGLDDRHLTEQLKGLRHELSIALEQLPRAERLNARDTPGDVGTEVTLSSESRRVDVWQVASASLKRTGEALRSLEEFGKVIDPSFAARIESLRYRLYTLEKAMGLTCDHLSRLEGATLYVLLDGRGSPEAFEKIARELIDAGADVIQLRDKQLNDRDLLERARRLRSLTAGTRTLFVMNDRPDLAAIVEADGVHVGQDELPVRDVRRIVGPRMLIGVSTHSLEQARQAVLDGASYIGVGPTFSSRTKAFASFTGLELLREAAAAIRLPAFAIGGITLDRLDDVLATGISRVAVSAAIAQATSPGAAAREFQRRLKAAGPPHLLHPFQ